MLAAVDRGAPGEPAVVRATACEEKDFTTIWLTLGQRTLHYETYVMPAPEENQEQFYEHLLRRNAKLVGAQFCVALENAVYLVGAPSRPALSTTPSSMSRGFAHTCVEQCFRPALLIGFASRFALDVSVHFMSFCVAPRAAGSLVRGSPVSRCALGSRHRRHP